MLFYLYSLWSDKQIVIVIVQSELFQMHIILFLNK